MTLFGWARLAGTTFAAALLQAVSGFGFGVLAVPLYLLLVAPAQAVQLTIILSTALSFAVVRGLRRIIAPALLLRLSAGSLAGMPIGLFSFRYADRLLVRFVVGATILGFGVMRAVRRRERRPWAPFGRTSALDLAAGAVAGVATALVGMAGPSVLIYLLLAGRRRKPCARRFSHSLRCHTGQLLRLMPRPSASLSPPGWRPASLRPLLCWVALSVGRSATAWAATALPYWRSRCSPPPGFIRWRPRVSVF
jgi:hypothetical protein